MITSKAWVCASFQSPALLLVIIGKITKIVSMFITQFIYVKNEHFSISMHNVSIVYIVSCFVVVGIPYTIMFFHIPILVSIFSMLWDLIYIYAVFLDLLSKRCHCPVRFFLSSVGEVKPQRSKCVCLYIYIWCFIVKVYGVEYLNLGWQCDVKSWLHINTPFELLFL